MVFQGTVNPIWFLPSFTIWLCGQEKPWESLLLSEETRLDQMRNFGAAEGGIIFI